MNIKIKKLTTGLLAMMWCLFADPAKAHEPDHTYIFLSVYKAEIQGRIEITASDANRELGLSMNEEIEESELTPHIPAIKAFLLSRVSFGSGGQNYPIRFTETKVLDLDDEEDYIEFHFALDQVSEIPEHLDISYNTFFDKAPNHRGVLIVEHNWKAGIVDNHSLIAEVFTKGETSKQLSMADASLWNGFVAMVKLGMWHIWIGLDHILFLLALILPSVVRRRKNDGSPEEAAAAPVSWVPVPRFKPAGLYLIKIVTFFTIAHSITLAIAALGYVDLSARYVESIIAISIAIAALHNITPIFKSKEWIIVSAFGLFHGFGFASVLGEKGLGGEYMALSLLGFNVGVEIGQVLIVSGMFPILYFIRKSSIYPKFITFGSVLLIMISLYWVIERFFEVDLPLGSWVNAILG